MNPRTAFISLCILLFAGCDSDEGRDGSNSGNRRITEIVGQCEEVYSGTMYRQNSLHRFFYDDEGRLCRWIHTTSSTYDGLAEYDFRIAYESDAHLDVSGSYTWDSTTGKEIAAAIGLDPAGRIIRIDMDNDRYTYRYSDGLLSNVTDPYSTADYIWPNGDLTAIHYSLSSATETGSEYSTYGSERNIANLELNYLAYETEWFSLPADQLSSMLGAAGLFGRSAHLVVMNSDKNRRCDIRWTFDDRGYPTGWISEYANYRYRHTIYYND